MRLNRSAICLILLCGLACSGASAVADINQAQRAEDKRLEAFVTVPEARVHVAELLSRLSTQTGVELKINARMDASGITLMASLIHLPLADVMNALASLTGCRSARWYWERQGKPGHFTYWLQAPQLNETAARLRGKAQGDFERQAATLIKAAGMSVEERKALTNQSKADAAAIADPRVMSGVKIFSDAVPSDMQRQILRGETTLRIPFSQLSPEGQAYARAEYRRSGIVDREPDTVFFNVDPLNMITPTLFMEVGDIGGHGYVGGVPLHNQFKEELAGEWMLPGDAPTNPIDAAVITRPKDYKPTVVPEVDLQNADKLSRKELDDYFARSHNVVQKRLTQMSEAVPVSLMAIVPESQLDAGEPYGQTVGHFVSSLCQPAYGFLSKWHGKVLLLSYGRWFLNMDVYVSYDTLLRLREQQRRGQGVFSLKALAAAADGLSVRQISSLATDYPVFKTVSDLRGLFVLYHRFPEVEAAEGAVITPEMNQLLDPTTKAHLPGLAEGARIRIREITKNTPPALSSQIEFQLIQPDGKPSNGLGIQQGIPPTPHK